MRFRWRKSCYDILHSSSVAPRSRYFPLLPPFRQLRSTERTIKEVTYWWPRPGSDKALEKTTFYTKVGDQNCGVGYYKE